jgi:hypothetical protein
MPSEFYDLPPKERVSAVVHADGAFVVRIGKHAVGIRDGIVFDNDLHFSAAINARAVTDPVALFAAIGLGGGISQARRVVVGAVAKELLTCVEMMDSEEDSPAGSRLSESVENPMRNEVSRTALQQHKPSVQSERSRASRSSVKFNPPVVIYDQIKKAPLWVMSLAAVAIIVWTGLSELNGKRRKPTALSTAFPIALMEKYCDKVDTGVLEGTFATPVALVFFSMLAPVLVALSDVVQKPTIAWLCDVVDWVANNRCCNKNTAGDFAKWLKDSVRLEKDEDEKELSTFEDYALDQAEQNAKRSIERSQSMAFTAMHLVLALAVLVDYIIHIQKAVTGDHMMCHVSKVLVAPLFKAFALSMWTVLMAVTNYVHWEATRKLTPKEEVFENKMPAPERPMNRNMFSFVIFYVVAAVLGVWVCVALVVSPTLVGFFPVAFLLLVIVPLVFLVLPVAIVAMLAWAVSKWISGLDEKCISVLGLLRKHPLLMLKVGIVQLFTTAILLAWFAGVYYGEESWSSASEALWSASIPKVVLTLPSLVFEVTFQWPRFSVDFEISFYLLVCSVGLLGVEFLLKVVQWGDMLLGDRYKTLSYATQYTVFTVRSLGTGPMAPFMALTERCSGSGKLDDESTWANERKDQKYGKVDDEKIERYARNNAADLAEKGVDLSHCTKLTNQALWSVAYYLDKERLVDDASTEDKAPETAPENAGESTSQPPQGSNAVEGVARSSSSHPPRAKEKMYPVA